jgi:hypothetical protein
VSQNPSNISAALSTRKASGCSGCFAWPFALIFLGVGLIFSYMLTFQPLWGMLRSRDWVQTPCKILSSELNGNGDSSRIAVSFAYSVGNKEYTSERYCFLAMSSNTAGGWKRRVIAEYPAGKVTSCFVNPGDPADAVIERGWVPDMWWGLFPIPFVLVGFGALLVAMGIIKVSNPNAPGTPASWQPSPVATRTERGTDEFDDSSAESSFTESGPVTLKPSISPIQKLIGAIFVAAFWNGIVSVFVWQQVAAFQRGGFAALEWFSTLFLVPFVLIGLGMIGFVLYTLLSLFNPRPTLTVNSAAIPLGGELQLNWSFSGRPGSIREFKISLKGTEQATYRRGTTTTTDKNTFAEIVLFETTEMFDMEEGSAKVTVPADTMHSFDAPNNKIVWTLEVHGAIPLWPDVSESFPITVLPRPIGG